jgi:hypothetical protein
LKRFFYGLTLLILIALGLTGYFLIELYRPFEAKITPPKQLELRYSGPGSLPLDLDAQTSEMQEAGL